MIFRSPSKSRCQAPNNFGIDILPFDWKARASLVSMGSDMPQSISTHSAPLDFGPGPRAKYMDVEFYDDDDLGRTVPVLLLFEEVHLRIVTVSWTGEFVNNSNLIVHSRSPANCSSVKPKLKSQSSSITSTSMISLATAKSLPASLSNGETMKL